MVKIKTQKILSKVVISDLVFFKYKSRSEFFVSNIWMESYLFQRTGSRQWDSNKVRFFVFIRIFPSLFDKLIFVEYFEPTIISIFYLIVSSISKLFFNLFPFFSILVDALDNFEILFKTPVIPFDFRSEIIYVALFNLFRTSIYNKFYFYF